VSKTFQRIIELIQNNELLISSHGYDELSNESIFVRDVLGSLGEATVVEDYPDYWKGPCVLTLQKDPAGNPIHVVWGIPKGRSFPAVLITAYRPDPRRWSEDFLRRRR
jgi:hypothetical protein